MPQLIHPGQIGVEFGHNRLFAAGDKIVVTLRGKGLLLHYAVVFKEPPCKIEALRFGDFQPQFPALFYIDGLFLAFAQRKTTVDVVEKGVGPSHRYNARARFLHLDGNLFTHRCVPENVQGKRLGFKDHLPVLIFAGKLLHFGFALDVVHHVVGYVLEGRRNGYFHFSVGLHLGAFLKNRDVNDRQVRLLKGGTPFRQQGQRFLNRLIGQVALFRYELGASFEASALQDNAHIAFQFLQLDLTAVAPAAAVTAVAACKQEYA